MHQEILQDNLALRIRQGGAWDTLLFLCGKEGNKLLHFTVSQRVAKCRHHLAAVANLQCDVGLMKPASDTAEVGATVGADRVDSMTVLAAALVEENGAMLTIVFG